MKKFVKWINYLKYFIFMIVRAGIHWKKSPIARQKNREQVHNPDITQTVVCGVVFCPPCSLNFLFTVLSSKNIYRINQNNIRSNFFTSHLHPITKDRLTSATEFPLTMHCKIFLFKKTCNRNENVFNSVMKKIGHFLKK